MKEAIGTIWKRNQMRSSLVSVKNSSILHNKTERYNSRSASKDSGIKVPYEKNILKITQKLRRKPTIEQMSNSKGESSKICQSLKEKQRSLKTIIGNSIKQLKNTEDQITTQQYLKNLTIQKIFQIISKLRSVVQEVDYIVKHFNEQINLITKKSINQITIFSRRMLESSKKSQLLSVPVLKKNEELLSMEGSLMISQQIKQKQQFANQITFHVQNKAIFENKEQVKFKGSFDNIKRRTIGLYQKSREAESRIVDKIKIPKNSLISKTLITQRAQRQQNPNEKSRLKFQLKKINTLTSLFSQDVRPAQSRTEIQGNLQNRNPNRSVSKQMNKMNEAISNMRTLIIRNQPK